MAGLLLDFRHALRGLLKAMPFTLAAVFTLALGIGANSAMFSAIDALLLRPLPYPHPERLLSLTETSARGKGGQPLSSPDFFDVRDQAGTFQGAAAYASERLDLAGWGPPVSVRSGEVTAGFFELFALRPLAGAFFTRDQETPGRDNAVVISQGLWQRRFGGDPAVIGRSLVLSGTSRLILGVAPATTPFPLDDPPELFVPLTRDPKGQNRGFHHLHAIARLREGDRTAPARAELAVIAGHLARQYPDTNQGRTLACEDLHAAMAGTTGRSLLLLMGAVGLFLLIAMANVASLFLARTAGRRYEVAVRISLGATRFHLARHFLAEGFLVALGGTLLGLGGARLVLAVLPAFLPGAGGLKGIQPIHLDGTVLAFTSLISLGVLVLFSLAPMVAAQGASLHEGLLAGGRSSTQRAGRLRTSLVTLEVALATVLLLTSGLLLHGLAKAAGHDPGFQPRGVAIFNFRLPESRYQAEASQAQFHRNLMLGLASLPGVESLGAAYLSPSSDNRATVTYHDGPTSELQAVWPTAPINVVDPGFFKTLRIPLKTGRMFADTDLPASPRVMLVNEAFARTLQPGSPILGRRLRVGFTSEGAPEGTFWEIVGVVGDIRADGLDRPPGPTMFLPIGQMPLDLETVFLRTRGAVGLDAAIQKQMDAVDPLVAPSRVLDLEAMTRGTLTDRRQTVLLLGTFALMALFLGAIGIYGLLAYVVAQRLRELGIRMALGARQGQILRLVMGQGVRLVLLGLALGVVAYLAAGRVLAHLVVDLNTADPATLLAVPCLLAAVGLLACLLPALRASRVDPAIALRNE